FADSVDLTDDSGNSRTNARAFPPSILITSGTTYDIERENVPHNCLIHIDQDYPNDTFSIELPSHEFPELEPGYSFLIHCSFNVYQNIALSIRNYLGSHLFDINGFQWVTVRCTLLGAHGKWL